MINGLLMVNTKTEEEKRLYENYGIIIKSVQIAAPDVQDHRVGIIGRNGSVDLTEAVTGNVRYNDRSIDIDVRFLGNENQRTAKVSELENFAHGQKLKFIFDDDDAFYYLGRIDSVSPPKVVNNKALDFTLSLTVDPYKYNITTSAEDWLWDPFDFEEGMINETANMEVDGELTYTLLAQRRWECPIIISNSAMTLEYDEGEPINIVAGSQVMYDIIITEGEHTFKFTGNGTVTINYVGGML